jgi:hypothetical protein
MSQAPFIDNLVMWYCSDLATKKKKRKRGKKLGARETHLGPDVVVSSSDMKTKQKRNIYIYQGHEKCFSGPTCCHGAVW